MKAIVPHLAVATLIILSPLAVRSAEPQRRDESPEPHDTAIVEIAAPPGASFSFDDQDEKKTAQVTFGPLKTGQAAKHKLTVHFASGETVSKILLLRGEREFVSRCEIRRRRSRFWEEKSGLW
jgi:hypothetical protein